jgi:hypothetical protein
MSDSDAHEASGDLLDTPVRVPEHVIFRSFARETVALNLQTGKFHGLNPSAGRMVEMVSRASVPRDAVAPLAEEYRVPNARLAADLSSLLRLLIDRGLLETDA